MKTGNYGKNSLFQPKNGFFHTSKLFFMKNLLDILLSKYLLQMVKIQFLVKKGQKGRHGWVQHEHVFFQCHCILVPARVTWLNTAREQTCTLHNLISSYCSQVCMKVPTFLFILDQFSWFLFFIFLPCTCTLIIFLLASAVPLFLPPLYFLLC